METSQHDAQDGREGRVQEGRYLAENGRWFVDLRVEDEPRTFSADLRGPARAGVVELSVRTHPFDVGAPDDEGWVGGAADWTDASGAVSGGSVRLRPAGGRGHAVVAGVAGADGAGADGAGADGAGADGAGADGVGADRGLVTAVFVLDRALGAVPAFSVEVTAAQVSSALRDLGVGIAWEDGVADDEERTAWTSATTRLLRASKLDVHPLGQAAPVESPPGGAWATATIFEMLQRQVGRIAPSSLDTAAFELRVLMLSETNRPGLGGLMFDLGDDRPRQAAAIFVDEIRRRSGSATGGVTRRLTSAIGHEIGHCLNLRHRFGSGIDRADSTSYMNYDWTYQGGGHAQEYWDVDDRTFDEDELAFLRHGPRHELIPGGAPFGSARYWTSGAVGAPADGTPVLRDLELWLTPPRTGTRFRHGQPVFLEVSVRNVGSRERRLPRHVLDLKAGVLEVRVQRRDRRSWLSAAESAPFVPFVQRCFMIAGPELLHLRPGESLHENLSLSFGSGGFPLAEPGDYRVTPVLTLRSETAGVDGLVEGRSLDLTVEAPASRAEERQAALLLRADVGTYLALGGVDGMPEVEHELTALVADRERATDGRPDGACVAVRRARGIHAERRGDVVTACSLLERVVAPESLATLDPHTAEHTQRLTQRVRGARVAPGVVRVDLAVRRPSGRVERSRLSGVLVPAPADATGSGVPALRRATVLVAGDTLGAVEDQVHAAVVLHSPDGLTERVAVTAVALWGAADGSEAPVSALELARDVPVPRSAAAAGPASVPWGEAADEAQVRGALDRWGATPPVDTAWIQDDPEAAATRSGPAASSDVPRATRGPDVPWAEVAWRVCWLFDFCDDDDVQARRASSMPEMETDRAEAAAATPHEGQDAEQVVSAQ